MDKRWRHRRRASRVIRVDGESASSDHPTGVAGCDIWQGPGSRADRYASVPWRRTGLQLALVFCFVKMPLRLGDETIGTNRPFLVPANANGLAGASGASVRPGPRPMKDGVAAVLTHRVHLHDHVGKSGHVSLGGGADRRAPDGRSTGIHCQGAVLGVERREPVWMLAAPGCS